MTTPKKTSTETKSQTSARTTDNKKVSHRQTESISEIFEKISQEDISQLLEKERAELNQSEQIQLSSFTEIYSQRDRDRKLYSSKASTKPITLTFNNLRANSKVFLSLREDQNAIFHAGNKQDKLSGLRLSTQKDPVLNLRNFLVNARELYLQTFSDCSTITLNVSILTDQDFLKGKVDLPPNASVTIQTQTDRSSLIGLSSFAIDLN